MSTATEADLKTLATEVATLRADLTSITETLQDLVRHGAGDASTVIQDSYGRLQGELDRTKRRVVHEIEQQPVTAALTAFGVGLLLGMACRR